MEHNFVGELQPLPYETGRKELAAIEAEQANTERTNSALNLRVSISNNGGRPVYITDISDFLVYFRKEGAEAFDLESIYRDLSNKNNTDFANPIENNAEKSPVIVLINDADTKAKNKSNFVFNVLKKANVTAYKQTANKSIKVITATDAEEIRQELSRQYQKEHSAGGTIADFYKEIQTNKNTPAIKTGFEQFDRILDGGLYEGLYAIGAITSLGKTTFCLNLAEQIAATGQDVIVFALEMSKFSLIARSISRQTFIRYKAHEDTIKYEWCKTSRGISDGSRYDNYTEDEKRLIGDSMRYYEEHIGKHLYFYEAVGDFTVETIREKIEEHMAYNAGHRPVVFVDYLQLIQHKDNYINANDKIKTDYNLTKLKQVSRDYKLPIVAISSFNRTNYNTEVKFESFKESGGIDFTCDVIIGLQLAGVGAPDFDVNTAKAKNPREIELVFLKNREAATGGKIKYYYYPMFNHFIESLEDVNGRRDFEADRNAEMVNKIRNYHKKTN